MKKSVFFGFFLPLLTPFVLMMLSFSWSVMQFQALVFQRNLRTVCIEQEAEDSSDMLVAMYQITWYHIPNTAVLMVISVRTSNIISVYVANNLIPPFHYYSQQEEHEKYAYQISGILRTSYYRQFNFQVKV